MNIETKMVGDTEGIKLWNLMSSSIDKAEKEYFKRLNIVATKFGSVWFTDIIEERESSHSQAIFFLKWESDKTQWKISLFIIPKGATKEIQSRMEIEYVNVDDIVELN